MTEHTELLEALRACAGYASAGLLANTRGKAIKLQQVRDTAQAAIAKATLVTADAPFPHREN